jgi:hypothetical protein
MGIKNSYVLGDIFKGIRCEVLSLTLVEIAEHLHTSVATYNRFERNNFGKIAFNAKALPI